MKSCRRWRNPGSTTQRRRANPKTRWTRRMKTNPNRVPPKARSRPARRRVRRVAQGDHRMARRNRRVNAAAAGRSELGQEGSEERRRPPSLHNVWDLNGRREAIALAFTAHQEAGLHEFAQKF